MSDNNETRDALDRICEAYGFTSRLQLAIYLGKTASYVNNKVARNSFPYDLIVECALQKGVSLRWLVSGEGKMYEDIKNDTIYIPTYIFKESSLFKGDKVMFDKVMLPSFENELAIIVDGDIRYFIDMTDKLTTDGKYLIKYSDTVNIRDLTILPGRKIRIDWGKYPIDCTIDDIEISGKVVATYMEHKQ
ncbi:phage repressor protein CI [Proteus terrae]|uniref:phage repressor protein CI n=1 Tax=Proteus terrae TaxID=1574161 RepID=UPI001BA50950|nr:phage repressor protein CI [Proteus terrae]QUT00615.1 phage repressor protein CI [Proteus terrae subsp. cibarius]